MARVVIEGFPDDLLRTLKIRAVNERTSVKALLIAAAQKIGKASTTASEPSPAAKVEQGRAPSFHPDPKSKGGGK